MKQYKHIRVKAKGFKGTFQVKYIYYSKKDEKSPREIIDSYAEQGFRFVGVVPISSVHFGLLKEYDLVFEIENNN